ncbi:hypothetical protein [Burkholderia phage BCSR5]|nr:hypothetical protein [Burkholderia phage BCSR5]
MKANFSVSQFLRDGEESKRYKVTPIVPGYAQIEDIRQNRVVVQSVDIDLAPSLLRFLHNRSVLQENGFVEGRFPRVKKEVGNQS